MCCHKCSETIVFEASKRRLRETRCVDMVNVDLSALEIRSVLLLKRNHEIRVGIDARACIDCVHSFLLVRNDCGSECSKGERQAPRCVLLVCESENGRDMRSLGGWERSSWAVFKEVSMCASIESCIFETGTPISGAKTARFPRISCGCWPHSSTASRRPQVWSVVHADPPSVSPPCHVSIRHIISFVHSLLSCLQRLRCHLFFTFVPFLGLNFSCFSSRAPALSSAPLVLSLALYLSLSLASPFQLLLSPVLLLAFALSFPPPLPFAPSASSRPTSSHPPCGSPLLPHSSLPV